MLGSNSTDGELGAVLRWAVNPKRAADAISLSVARPQETNMFPVLLAGYYLGDRITASGVNNPLRLSSRTFDFREKHSRGYERH
jgi:hypothetical protein